MNKKKIFKYIRNNIESLSSESKETTYIWEQFLKVHPADIAQFLSTLSKEEFKKIYLDLPNHLQLAVFAHISDTLKIYILSFLDDHDRALILSHTPIDELTDLFEILSDQELKKYLTLLSKKDRKKILSLMQFDPESAGGIMDTDVLTLMQDFTVEKSVHVLRRLKPRLELRQHIYVTNQENQLVGYIRLEDLILKSPERRLSSFLKKSPVVIHPNEDQETVAKKMRHYNTTSAPVVGEHNYFLGEIVSDTLLEIIEKEASEDVYHMSAMPAIQYTYFQTRFLKMLFERSYILIGLLMAQSLSSMIIKNYEATLTGFLMYFITMLISTGGNTSSQTSAVVIQGMASGEITVANVWRFLRREFLMALCLGLIVGGFGFLRVYFTQGTIIGSLAVSLSLSLIVLVSVILGSCIPLILKKLNIDPAFAAGPFLATLMDILGLLIYCFVSNWILFR